MSSQQHTVSAHFARAFLHGAKRQGLDQAALLQQAFLSPAMIRAPDQRITSEQLSLLARAVMQGGDDELLGLSRHPLRYGVFGLFARSAVHCNCLRDVYHTLCRFYNLVGRAFHLGWSESGKSACLSMTLADPELDRDHFMGEFLMLMWHRFPSWLIGRRIGLQRLEFAFPRPPHAAEYRLMYPCEVTFNNNTNRLWLEPELLDTPVRQTPTSLLPYLRRIPFDWFRRQVYHAVHTREVLNLLRQGQPPGNQDIDTIASRLNLTSRTLRRRLRGEGTRFQTLKDDLRRDLAMQLLSQPDLNLAAISERLGFSDPAAFSRAFRSWTGIPPSAYRRE